MIPLIPAIALVGMLTLTLLWYAGTSLFEVHELHGGATTNTQERLQERLYGVYEGTPTNIQDVKILSEWTDDSVITAIVVKCPNGSVFTIEVGEARGGLVHGGDTWTIPPTIQQEMQGIAATVSPGGCS